MSEVRPAVHSYYRHDVSTTPIYHYRNAHLVLPLDSCYLKFRLFARMVESHLKVVKESITTKEPREIKLFDESGEHINHPIGLDINLDLMKVGVSPASVDTAYRCRDTAL